MVGSAAFIQVIAGDVPTVCLQVIPYLSMACKWLVFSVHADCMIRAKTGGRNALKQFAWSGRRPKKTGALRLPFYASVVVTMLVFAMAIRVATAAMVVAVVATVIAVAIAAIVAVAFIAHVVTQRATGPTASGRAYQGTCAAADTAAQHVAACSTQRAANGCFATAAFVGTYGTTCRTTHTCTNRRTGRAAELLANNGAKNPA
jgi:hypothetical protein